jgi:hypothetical protein
MDKDIFRITRTRIHNCDESKGAPEYIKPDETRVIARFKADASYAQKKRDDPVWYSAGYFPETECNGWISNLYRLERLNEKTKEWEWICFIEPRDADERYDTEV